MTRQELKTLGELLRKLQSERVLKIMKEYQLQQATIMELINIDDYYKIIESCDNLIKTLKTYKPTK
ncbi:MAG: hypothetical protein IJG09_09925 [Methanobrevibacter sp.]|nr:hypothetical protein [Methanobrevibacter sp.]